MLRTGGLRHPSAAGMLATIAEAKSCQEAESGAAI
jgi:hypothetical protein